MHTPEILLFDLDGTLFDSKKFTLLFREICEKKFGISQTVYQSAREEYNASLSKNTDFNPRDFCKILSDRTNVAYESIFSLFWQEKSLYKQSVYDDVFISLERLLKKYVLGVFSEGVIDYQKHKLEFSGLHPFFSSDHMFISTRKLEDNLSVKFAKNSLIIDDKKEVVLALKKENIETIWINRKTDEKLQGVRTIRSLDEIFNS